MALIGKIRRNPWILIVMIALGLGGFLLMDTMTSAQGPGGGANQMVLGEIDGEKIDRQEFENVYGLLYQNSAGNPYANRGQLWNWYVEDRIIDEEAEDLGLGVSRTELSDLEFGDNLSPIIVQRFSNPQAPGQVDRNQLNQFKTMIEQGQVQEAIEQGQIPRTFVPYWQHQRREIRKERLQAKLTNLVTKAMYVPTWMANMGYRDQNEFVDFAYVKVEYAEIANEDVSLSDNDLDTYLQDNKKRYNRAEETRRLQYVVFDVAATAADSAAMRTAMQADLAEWRSASNDSTFVLSRDGSISDQYFTQENLSPAIADTIMTLPVGNIYGPYIDGGSYRAVKLLDRQTVADSANTRHILISANTPAAFPQAEKTIDSLMNLLQTNQVPFDTLAQNFSQDPGSSTNGGVYEGVTPGQFVPEFNEILFFTGNIGQLYKVRTTYGYHLVEVLSRSASTSDRVKVAYLTESIIPTKETQDEAYERASIFTSNNRSLEDMRAAAAEAGLQVVTTDPLLKSDFQIGELGYGSDTRQMVCWAFSADPGEVSPEVYTFTDNNTFFDNKYVVIGLEDIIPDGLPKVADIRDELEAEVMKEKKAETIKGQINGTNLTAIAQQFSTQVDTVRNVTYSTPFVNGLGTEPAVLAAASKLAQGETSSPITGNTGVFVVQMVRKPTLGEPSNIPQVRQSMATTFRTPVAQSLMPFLIDGADIEDNRSTFDCQSF